MKKFKLMLLGLLVFSMLAFAINFRTANFIATDYTVPINSTQVEGAGFDSNIIGLSYATYSAFTFYVKGNDASCSEEVVFKFAAYDSLRGTWDTIAYIEVSLAANGTTAVQKTVLIHPSVMKIKLLSIQNQETEVGYTVDVNVFVFIKDQL